MATIYENKDAPVFEGYVGKTTTNATNYAADNDVFITPFLKSALLGRTLALNCYTSRVSSSGILTVGSGGVITLAAGCTDVVYTADVSGAGTDNKINIGWYAVDGIDYLGIKQTFAATLPEKTRISVIA
jgi:hypothetical protein